MVVPVSAACCAPGIFPDIAHVADEFHFTRPQGIHRKSPASTWRGSRWGQIVPFSLNPRLWLYHQAALDYFKPTMVTLETLAASVPVVGPIIMSTLKDAPVSEVRPCFHYS
jgi:hypothetical protein